MNITRLEYESLRLKQNRGKCICPSTVGTFLSIVHGVLYKYIEKNVPGSSVYASRRF